MCNPTAPFLFLAPNISHAHLLQRLTSPPSLTKLIRRNPMLHRPTTWSAERRKSPAGFAPALLGAIAASGYLVLSGVFHLASAQEVAPSVGEA